MFPKETRLGAEEIKNLVPYLCINSRFFSVKMAKNQVKKGRFAIIVPKKTAQLSVSRHSIKRKVSHLLRTLQKELSLKKQDYLIYVNNKAEEEASKNLRQDLLELINNNKLLFLE